MFLLVCLLLFVNPSASQRENLLELHDRDEDGAGHVHRKDENLSEKQETLTQHKKEDEPDLNHQQKDGLPVRFETINIDFSAVSVYQLS